MRTHTERERERERASVSERERERERASVSERERERESECVRERESECVREKERERERERESEYVRERERERQCTRDIILRFTLEPNWLKKLIFNPCVCIYIYTHIQTGRVKRFIKLNSVGKRHLPKAKRSFMAFNLLFELSGVWITTFTQKMAEYLRTYLQLVYSDGIGIT